jgi:hypothetical protein
VVSVGIVAGLELGEGQVSANNTLEALWTWLSVLAEVVIRDLSVVEVFEVGVANGRTESIFSALGFGAWLTGLETAFGERGSGVDRLVKNFGGGINSTLDLVTWHAGAVASMLSVHWLSVIESCGRRDGHGGHENACDLHDCCYQGIGRDLVERG